MAGAARRRIGVRACAGNACGHRDGLGIGCGCRFIPHLHVDGSAGDLDCPIRRDLANLHDGAAGVGGFGNRCADCGYDSDAGLEDARLGGIAARGRDADPA